MCVKYNTNQGTENLGTPLLAPLYRLTELSESRRSST